MNIIILGVRIIEDSDNRGSDNRGCTVIPRGGECFTHYQTLYQSLPELRSSERVILEPWPRQTVLQVPKMQENAERRAFTL